MLPKKMEDLTILMARDIVLNTVRCTVLHILCSFLLARGNQHVEDGLWGIVTNLEGRRQYNWAEAVYYFLVASLNKATAPIHSH